MEIKNKVLLDGVLDDFARDLKQVHEPDAHDKYVRYRGAARLKIEAVMPDVKVDKDTLAWLLKRLNRNDAAELMLAVSVGKPLTN